MSVKLKNFLVSVTMEGNEDGNKEREIETCFICKIKNFAGITSKATRIEKQEQYEIRTISEGENNGVKGVIRVRAITDQEDNTRYVMTTKVYFHDKKGCEEVELEVSKDMFEQIKAMAPIGHNKTRLFFPVEGSDLTWELDLYSNGAIKNPGEFEPWCRLELELPTSTTALPDFPIEFEEVIDTSKGKMSEEQKKLVDQLYQDVFIAHKAENFLPLST